MARKGAALSYLVATITQGSADAFVQASIATALTGLSKTAFRLKTIEIELGQARSVASGADYQFTLARKSYAAMPTSPMLEKANIFALRLGAAQASAVGFSFYDRIITHTYTDDDAPIIVEDPVYAQLDSASTSVANVLYVRLGYWQETISEVDRLTLIANSLS